MLFIASLTLLASAAWALPAGPAMSGMQGLSAMCCPPNQWQANLVDLNALSSMVQTMYVYDGTNKMEATRTTSILDNSMVQQTSTDHNTNMKYTVMADGTCTTGKPDNGFDDTCMGGNNTVAKNIQFFGNAKLAGKLEFNSWMFQRGRRNVIMAFTKDGCIPVLEGVMFDPTKPPAIVMFNDVTAVISEKALLAIPPACSGNSVVGKSFFPLVKHFQ